MNMKKIMAIVAFSVVLASGSAMAQDTTDEGDATIRLMGNAEAALPDAVMKEIRLPANMKEDFAAVENSAKGHDMANENRTRMGEGMMQGLAFQPLKPQDDKQQTGNHKYAKTHCITPGCQRVQTI